MASFPEDTLAYAATLVFCANFDGLVMVFKMGIIPPPHQPYSL